MKAKEEQLTFTSTMLKEFRPYLGMEKNLNRFLEQVNHLIHAPVYSFYIYDEKNNNYVLKAVRHMTDDEAEIQPSYSGLLPYSKEQYKPPISLPEHKYQPNIMMDYDGEVPILTIPIDGSKGMIRIGPLKKLKKQTRDRLEAIPALLSTPLGQLIEAERLKKQSDVYFTTDRAVRYISSLTMNQDEIIKTMMDMSVNAYGIEGGVFLLQTQNQVHVPYAVGLSSENKKQFTHNNNLQYLLKRLVKTDEIVVLRREHPDFEQVKQLVGKQTIDFFVIGKFFFQSSMGYVLIWDMSEVGKEKMKVNAVKQMIENLFTYLKFQAKNDVMKQSYTEMLKMLSDFIDDLTPYTIGYSEMMRRFSMVIAQEMNLPKEAIKDIGLAAYLSNIGILGISDGLINKEGKYTELEYEQMKLHAEVGAAIVESTIANEKVAIYIRHHHERMDGNGYPASLVDNEIPIGAKILAVVQTFLAKINGRSYRDPLTFDQALSVLRSASGTQLDEQIVETFIKWFNQKRRNPLVEGKALGSCRDMCCVPANICMKCAVYADGERKNCWEYENNNCKEHGKSCETCFIYTEYKNRSGRKVGSEIS